MVQISTLNGSILGLDIGDARIGLAVMHSVARLPRPIETIPNDMEAVETLKAIIKREDIKLLVCGIPRNLSGEETEQSKKIREKATFLSDKLNLEVLFADESLSSVRADEYQVRHGYEVPHDSLAACFILEEFLSTIDSVQTPTPTE